MHASNLRNLKYLFCTKTVVATCLLFLFGLNGIMAQEAEKRKVINLPNFDDRRMHFGFYLALNHASYRIKRSDFAGQNPDSVISVNPTGTPGFTLGFIFNLKVADYVDFRFVPGVGFYERWVDYQFPKGPQRQVMESTMAEFPFLFKFKSERRANTRMYLLAGAKYSMASGLRRKDKKPDE